MHREGKVREVRVFCFRPLLVPRCVEGSLRRPWLRILPRPFCYRLEWHTHIAAGIRRGPPITGNRFASRKQADSVV